MGEPCQAAETTMLIRWAAQMRCDRNGKLGGPCEVYNG